MIECVNYWLLINIVTVTDKNVYLYFYMYLTAITTTPACVSIFDDWIVNIIMISHLYWLKMEILSEVNIRKYCCIFPSFNLTRRSPFANQKKPFSVNLLTAMRSKWQPSAVCETTVANRSLRCFIEINAEYIVYTSDVRRLLMEEILGDEITLH